MPAAYSRAAQRGSRGRYGEARPCTRTMIPNMATVMVTGAHGFVGRHLVAELRSREALVIAVGKEPTSPFQGQQGVDYAQCDLLDSDAVDGLLARTPAAVINLAGLAAVGPSYGDPELYLRTNRQIAANLCDSALRRSPSARLLMVSSGAVYEPRQPLPLREDSEVGGSTSPYALSKLQSEQVALTARTSGVNAVVVRPFNHLGPGQEPGFLLPDLYARVRAAGNAGPVAVGNLATARDYTDVRDVARAYADLLVPTRLEHSIYNVCSGRAVTGTSLLEMLFAALGTPALPVVSDAGQLRPTDADVIFGAPGRLHAETGWQPKFDLTQSVQDYVQWRRARG